MVVMTFCIFSGLCAGEGVWHLWLGDACLFQLGSLDTERAIEEEGRQGGPLPCSEADTNTQGSLVTPKRADTLLFFHLSRWKPRACHVPVTQRQGDCGFPSAQVNSPGIPLTP